MHAHTFLLCWGRHASIKETALRTGVPADHLLVVVALEVFGLRNS